MSDGAPGIGEMIDELMTYKANCHRFFTGLAASTRAPAYAEKQREWVLNILKRAQEAQVYFPEEP